MVRSYTRKTNRQSWSERAMNQAISDVRNGLVGYQRAAENYGIALATLYRRCKSDKETQDAAKKSLGRFKTIFTTDQEKELVKYVLEMEKRLFGLTLTEFRSVVYQYAAKNNLTHNFNQETALAGRDWVYNFMKRHQEISLRRPENTSAARAAAFNKPNVLKFFNLLGELFDKFNFPPSRVYNCDETGITTVPNKPSKILSMKGKKQIGVLTSGERGTLVTAEICFSATGQYVPPLMIFPRAKKNPIFEVGLPPESIVMCHPSGWMQTNIFAPTWFDHFLRFAKPSEADPVLLILDGHSTHTKNINLVESAKQNHVHILVIPPHTSHRLQPLDVGFMGPLSAYYEQEAKSWMRNNPGKIITLYDVGKLFGAAFQRAASSQNAVNSFKHTGICPYNPHIFPEELFSPAETTDQERTEPSDNLVAREQCTTPPTNISISNINISDSPRASCSKDKTPPPKLPPKNISIFNKNISDIPRASGSKDKTPPLKLNHSTPDQGCSSPQPSFSKDKTSHQNVENQSCSHQEYYSPYDIMPLPKAQPKSRKTNVRRGKTMILTATPNLEELKQTHLLKTTHDAKKVKRKILQDSMTPVPVVPKRKRANKNDSVEYCSSDSSLPSDEDICNDSSDYSENDELSDIENKKPSYLEEVALINEIKVGDFLMIILTEEKRKTKKDFIGQVTNVLEHESKVNVKFMRKYRLSEDTYVFPEVNDESDVFKDEIKGRLTNFIRLRHGKIRFKL